MLEIFLKYLSQRSWFVDLADPTYICIERINVLFSFPYNNGGWFKLYFIYPSDIFRIQLLVYSTGSRLVINNKATNILSSEHKVLMSYYKTNGFYIKRFQPQVYNNVQPGLLK